MTHPERHDRRSVLKSFMTLPVVGAALTWSASVGAHDDDHPPRDKAWERRYDAVKALRLVLTTQLQHFKSTRKYAPLDELCECGDVCTLLGKERLARVGFGRAQFDRLCFDGNELIPGWAYTFTLSPAQDRYTITLRDTRGEGQPSFAADEQTVIYEGSLRAGTGAWASARDLIDGESISSMAPAPQAAARTSRLSAMVAALGSLFVVPLGATHCGHLSCCCIIEGGPTCCHDYPCQTPEEQSCTTEWENGCDCVVCGCACCRFSCANGCVYD